MDIKQIKNFIAIVEEGNISKAAKKLNMAQPPLSKQMQLLEDELKAKLFIRGARNITLTDAGNLLYTKAKSMIAISEQIPNDISHLKSGNLTIRIGVVSSLSGFFLKNIVPNFKKTYPNYVFDIYETDTYRLIDDMFHNVINIALVRTPFQESGLTSIFLKEEPMVAVGNKVFFKGYENKEIDLSFLNKVPLIIYRRWKDIIIKQLSAKGIDPSLACVNDDARTTISWAEMGYGIAIVPLSIVDNIENKNLVIKSLEKYLPNSKISLSYIKGQKLFKQEIDFVEFVNNGFEQR